MVTSATTIERDFPGRTFNRLVHNSHMFYQWAFALSCGVGERVE